MRDIGKLPKRVKSMKEAILKASNDNVKISASLRELSYFFILADEVLDEEMEKEDDNE